MTRPPILEDLMTVPKALCSALAATLIGGVTTALAPAASAATVSAEYVTSWSTSTGAWATKPSPDPSGITYLNSQLIISDGEVDEIPALYKGSNIFYASVTGVPAPAKSWTTLPASDEPTGISTFGNLFVVSDDTNPRIYLFDPGSDGRWVSGSDPNPKSFAPGTYATDPEDVTVDSDVTKDGHIVVVSGTNKEVVDYSAGPDGNFATTADNVVTHFDVGQYGAGDPEGIEYEPIRNTLLVLDDASGKIYELSRQGALLNIVTLPAQANFTKAAGMTLAPGTTGGNNLYVVDRGVDNNVDPKENDGRVVELRVALPPLPGGGGDTTAPTVTAKTPRDGKTGVSRTANVTATFSEAVQNVTTSTFKLTDPNGNVVAANVRLSSTTNKWVLNPSPTLAAGTRYTARVVGGTNGVKDAAGNPLAADVVWSFTTGA